MIQRYRTGEIKDFSVPDAHTFYVNAYLLKGNIRRPIRKEALTMPSLDTLDHFHIMKDPQDGFILSEKWGITPEVVKELKSKGSASHIFGIFRFEYYIRKVRHSSELRHRG